MEIGATSSAATLASAAQQTALGADVISKTLSELNQGGSGGVSSASGQAYDFSKAVLNAAYAEKGIGTRLNSVV